MFEKSEKENMFENFLKSIQQETLVQYVGNAHLRDILFQ